MRKISIYDTSFTVNEKALPEKHKNFWDSFEKDWESSTLDFLNRFINNKTTVVDIGAWNGCISLFAASKNAKKVISFEPDPEAFNYLQSNYESNENLSEIITITKKAVSNTTEGIKIGHLKDAEMGQSTTTINGENPILVDSTDIPSMFQQYDLHAAEKLLLKVDIEGAEQLIFSDFIAEIKKHNKPLGVVLELHPYHFGSASNRNKIKSQVKELISLFGEVEIINRRRMGEEIRYENDEELLFSEIDHPQGYLEIILKR